MKRTYYLIVLNGGVSNMATRGQSDRGYIVSRPLVCSKAVKHIRIACAHIADRVVLDQQAIVIARNMSRRVAVQTNSSNSHVRRVVRHEINHVVVNVDLLQRSPVKAPQRNSRRGHRES